MDTVGSPKSLGSTVALLYHFQRSLLLPLARKSEDRPLAAGWQPGSGFSGHGGATVVEVVDEDVDVVVDVSVVLVEEVDDELLVVEVLVVDVLVVEVVVGASVDVVVDVDEVSVVDVLVEVVDVDDVLVVGSVDVVVLDVLVGRAASCATKASDGDVKGVTGLPQVAALRPPT